MFNLVMGGLGFIGHNFVKKLIEAGEEVIVFDKFPPGGERHHKDVKYIQGDFTRDYNFISLTKNVDIVYHFISTTVPASNKDFVSGIEENVISTIELLDACIKNDVKRIVFLPSGGTVYGHSFHIPRKETDLTNPINSYGIQKLTIEKYLLLYQDIYDLDCRIIRLSNPYGPLQNPKGGVGAVTAFTFAAVNDLPITVWGDGKVIRDYIYIDDAVEGIYNIANCNTRESLFNLGSGRGHDLLDVLKFIGEATQKDLDIHYMPSRQIDLPYNVLDISKYAAISGSKPKTTLKSGIKMLADYYQSKKYISFNTRQAGITAAY